MKELGRFLRLERARKEGERDAPPSPSRFATLEEARVPTPTTPHPAAGLERFAPEPPPELELERADSAEPFVRCPHCGADSARHAVLCRQCEARLDSDEVRAFNVRLWAEMTAARDREARELRQWEERGGTPAGALDDRSERIDEEELVARQEARLALEAPSGWTSRGWFQRVSQGSPGAPRVVYGLALGVPVLLALSRHGTAAVWVVSLATLGVLLLLTARRRR